ncbi:unnamed protein product [Nippostrongylus brasiliensis]|uniref:Col_cuticle_N domain-containing protein n=1 Tax=Nippostrongylus brasiliensis TaxID=27835 RepID=A0A0N4XRC2_NIPBR|nr:unnamed protein product [Nippostrongylus brasiliensis]
MDANTKFAAYWTGALSAFVVATCLLGFVVISNDITAMYDDVMDVISEFKVRRGDFSKKGRKMLKV